MKNVYVYQKKDFVGFMLKAPDFVDINDYGLVAEVFADKNYVADAAILENAYALTNSIDDAWFDINEDVLKAYGQFRSTSVGDLVLIGNNMYVVAMCGFEVVAMSGFEHV